MYDGILSCLIFLLVLSIQSTIIVRCIIDRTLCDLLLYLSTFQFQTEPDTGSPELQRGYIIHICMRFLIRTHEISSLWVISTIR